MRFVSQFTPFSVGIKPGRKRFTDYGIEQVEPEIDAQFDPFGWNQHDMEVAFQNFKFRGQFQYEDEATPVNPAYRLAVYDTDEEALKNGWDEATKEVVEQRLLDAGSYGQAFIRVEEIALQPPWPTYDEFDGKPEALVVMVGDLGFDPEVVLHYEESKWGQQRPEVMQALQTAIEARDTGEIIVT
jgi:hypothetical protein